MKKLHPAYVAGILDGEGCISVGMRKRRHTLPYITPTVQVSNTNFEILNALKVQFGGNIYINRDRRPTRKLLGLWSCAGTNAIRIVAFAEPHLLIKRQHAAMFAALPRRPNGTRLKPSDFKRNVQVIRQFRLINKRGA